jgi:D-glycero-D-manno-heptose 1,7-bisphosphate phosphatase
MQMRRAVFLDRDGVINRAVMRDGRPYPPASLGEVEILPGVLDALTALRDAGFMLIVVTNQPDVARGTTSRAVVEEINTHLAGHLPIDEFRTCYHDSGDGCDCRKPLPGSLVAAAKQHGIDLGNSYMVGEIPRLGNVLGAEPFLSIMGTLKNSQNQQICVCAL